MLEEAGKLSQFDSTHKTGKSIRDQIKDGSIYIGQKFNDVFPFLRRRKTPNDFRISVNQYNSILSRLKKDNFSSKTMKQRDKTIKVNCIRSVMSEDSSINLKRGNSISMNGLNV